MVVPVSAGQLAQGGERGRVAKLARPEAAPAATCAQHGSSCISGGSVAGLEGGARLCAATSAGQERSSFADFLVPPLLDPAQYAKGA